MGWPSQALGVGWRIGADTSAAYPAQVHLFRDQTGKDDGDRKRQREGSPVGKGDLPDPLRPIRSMKNGSPDHNSDRRPRCTAFDGNRHRCYCGVDCT